MTAEFSKSFPMILVSGAHSDPPQQEHCKDRSSPVMSGRCLHWLTVNLTVLQVHSPLAALGCQLLIPEPCHETPLEAVETTNALWGICLGDPLPGDFRLLH